MQMQDYKIKNLGNRGNFSSLAQGLEGVINSNAAKPAESENLVKIESMPGIRYHSQLLLFLNCLIYHD